MAELRTVEGCGRIFTEEREEVIHHLAEMRVAETHTHTQNASQTKLLLFFNM